MILRVLSIPGVSIVLLATGCALALAAPGDRKGIVFRGRLADPDGWPIEKVQVAVEGSRTASALSDQDGRWSLAVPLGARSELGLGTLLLTLRVRDGARSYSLANGRSELRLELRAEGNSDGSPLLAVRANDARVAETVARALRAEGDTNVVVPVMFVGRPRGAATQPAGPDSFSNALPAYEPVLLAGRPAAGDSTAPSPAPTSARPTSPSTSAPVPATTRAVATQPSPVPPPPSAPVSTPTSDPPPSPIASPARGSASASMGVTLSPAPLTAAPLTPAPAPTEPSSSAPDVSNPPPAADSAVDPVPWSRVEVITPSRYRSLAKSDSALLARSPRGCACRIEGTIEVRSDQPLSRRRPIVVVLNGEVALRQTVDLFMGSPRGFAFRDLPCGRYSLDVQVPGSTRFRLVTPKAMRGVSCAQGETRQIRLVLEPR